MENVKYNDHMAQERENPADVISMSDMKAVFGVTDSFGINRESVSVSLEKKDPGAVSRSSNGEIEITVPLSQRLDVFTEALRKRLSEMGFELSQDPDD